MNYYIPQWEERTSYGFRRIDPYAKLFEDRIIFLGEPIDDFTANVVVAQLLFLQSQKRDADNGVDGAQEKLAGHVVHPVPDQRAAEVLVGRHVDETRLRAEGGAAGLIYRLRCHAQSSRPNAYCRTRLKIFAAWLAMCASILSSCRS